MISTRETYEKRKERYENLLKRQNQTINFISVLRFIIFFSGIGFSLYFYIRKHNYIALGILILTIVSFILLIMRHSKAIRNRNTAAALSNINNEAIQRVEGKWREFDDKGEEFIDENHNFSYDLDIFGKNSLFQWINTAVTHMGRNRLKELLAFPELNKVEIEKRQQAVLELSKDTAWRQRFRAEGTTSTKESKEVEKLIAWTKEKVTIKSYFKVLAVVLPVLTVISIAFYFLNKNIGYSLPLIFITINIIVLKLGQKLRIQYLDTVYEYKKRIDSFYKMLVMIEKRRFKSEKLNEFKKELMSSDGKASSKVIDDLGKITDKISDRNNVFTLIFNLLFLWDYHLIWMLEKWRISYGEDVEKWLNIIGEFEALSSLAIINFDNPHWATPRLLEEGLFLSAKQAAHPLLPRDAVSNDVSMGNSNRILLITGSNMSGKSTFLRTLGINLVLAYAGTAVCAQEFSCSLMNIFSCMRTSDNLEKNISSFYAEILRIKTIVKASDTGKPIFFLLDEIFKGTNSIDRHLGAETLIRKLSKQNAIGLVSTHDLELGEIEKKNGRVKNYHFEEYYRNNEIGFDYKLKSGVSNTRNAVYLMKLAGIDFENS